MRSRILSGVGSGLGWGIGMGIAMGMVAIAGGGMRPVAKGAVKGGLWAKDRMTVVLAEARERAEDIYHEARAERAEDEALRNGDGVALVAPRPRRTATAPVRRG